jgi:hypothetical protein
MLVPIEDLRMDFNPTARRDEVAVELTVLRQEFDAWKGGLAIGPAAGFHKTQLARLDQVVKRAIKDIATALGNVVLDRPADEVYDTLQLYDFRVVWLRRVWHFYREKFDQRADPALKDHLAAADEVVWSCHAPIFRNRPKLPQRPAPLSYFDSYYSPMALPVDRVPESLRDRNVGDDFFKKMLRCLPIPVVRLPPVCARAPWWLVYLGHEIGHQVQFNLVADEGMVKAIEERLEDVAKKHGHAADADKWKQWSVEIFADAFSVLVMGPWAIWALLEFEFNRADEMAKRKCFYPSPAVRLRLMEHVARSKMVGLDPTLALRGIRLDELAEKNELVRSDFELVPYVVDAVLGKLPGLSLTLPQLCGFRRLDFEDEPGKKAIVPAWAKALLGSGPLLPESDVNAARLVTAGAVSAWSTVMCIQNGKEREKRRQALAARALDLIKRSQEPGTRAAPAEHAERGGESLAQFLLTANHRELQP